MLLKGPAGEMNEQQCSLPLLGTTPLSKALKLEQSQSELLSKKRWGFFLDAEVEIRLFFPQHVIK